ncbi:MAG: hypothetical protein WBA46_14115 [Thermomicrobiales bacterium]
MTDAPGSPALATAIVDIATQLAEQLRSPTTERRIAAMSLVMTLDRLTDHAMHAVVRDARRAGMSWQQIADITGTSRQGAAQRFGSDAPDPGDTHALDLATEPLPDAIPLAARIVTAFMTDDRPGFRPFMARSMAAALTDRRLASSRRLLAASLGTFEATSTEGATLTVMGDLTVVQIPLRFSDGTAVARVSFTPDTRMLGFWIEPESPLEGPSDHG